MRGIEHIGSAHDEARVELLKALARQRLAAWQDELDLGLQTGKNAKPGGGPLPITSSRMGHLCDGLSHTYDVLGFAHAAGGDEVFRQLVLAMIRAGCQPASSTPQACWKNLLQRPALITFA